MKNKTFTLLILSMLTLLALSVSVSAVTLFQNFVTPVTGETISGVHDFNIEVNGTKYNHTDLGGGSNVTNVTFFATPTTPSGGAEIFLCTNSSNVNNDTSSNWICSYDTATDLFDSGIYTITARIYNSSTLPTVVNSSTVTLVVTDNTNPVSILTSPLDGATVDQGFLIQATCTNASSAILTLESGDASMTFDSTSFGAETCQFDFGVNQPPQKLYNGVTITTIDQNDDRTTSAEFSLEVDGASSTRRQRGGGAAAALIMDANGGSLAVTSDGGAPGLSISGGLGSLFSFDTMNIVLIAAIIFLVLPISAGLGPFRFVALVVVIGIWIARFFIN